MKLPPFSYVPVEEWILSRVERRSVLHLGCAGDFLVHGPSACLHIQLAKVATDLWGIELDNAALDQVKEWLPEDEKGHYRYFCADVQRLKHSGISRKFDVILAGSIIEHLSNPGDMLNEIKPLCSDDGEIIIVTPNPFGLLQFMRVTFRGIEAVNPQHTSWFSVATLSELCLRYGLVPKEWLTGYGWRPPTVKWKIQKFFGVRFFKFFSHIGGSLIGVFKQAANMKL